MIAAPAKSKRSAERVVGITDYFMSLPPTRYLLIAIMLLGFAFGILINLTKYTGVDLFLKGSIDGSLLLSIPALISSAVIKLMIRRVPLRRVVATTLVGEIIYAITYGAGFFLAAVNPIYAEMIIFIGAALVFVLWYAIGRLIFILRFRSVLFAVIQLLFHLVFLLSSSTIYVSAEPVSSIAKFYVAALVLLIALLVFFFIVNAPLKKSFGVSGTDAFSHVVGQWLYGDTELEKTFENVGQEARTLATILAFKREKDSVYFVVPCVHFGPFGTLGGSEFSHLVSTELAKRHNAKTFVFHGTATHDLNPVSRTEIIKLLDACESCLKNARYEDAKISFSYGNEAECNAEALLINDSAFIGLSRAPHVTEDISFGVGLSIINDAEKRVSLAAVVDQHNAETGEILSFEPGDMVSYNYMRATAAALIKKAKERQNALRIGIAEMYPEHSFLGKAGVKVAVFSSSPEYVLILIDSNGITPDFRDKLIGEVNDIGRQHNKEWVVGVYTTDTHQRNMVRGVRNPLKEERAFLEDVKAAVIAASRDMQRARFYAAKKWFDIRIIGAKQSIEIVSTLNAMVSVAKLVAPLLFIGSVAAILLILRRT